MSQADPKWALFEAYLATAEKVSERRAGANSWMLTVNSAIVGLYGYLQADKLAVSAGQKAIWLWAIPIAGIIVCVAWNALLESYRKLNSAKFTVLQQLEAELPSQPFAREQEAYRRAGRRGLATVEKFIPLCFILLYGAILGAAILR